jgi:nitroreductase
MLLMSRRSVRLFDEQMISKESIEAVIDTASNAPTASNRRDIRYIVVSGFDRVDELRRVLERFAEKVFGMLENPLVSLFLRMRYGHLFLEEMRGYAIVYNLIKRRQDRGANFILPRGPCVIVAHAKTSQLASFNCAAALHNGALMAHAMDLGSCFLGFLQVAANMDGSTKHWLNIPKGNQCNGAMILGHPDITYLRMVKRLEPKISWLPNR